MKNICLIIRAILFTSAMSLNSFAGDCAELIFVGFSLDGKYLAFEESGERDVHLGGDYATTYFVNVAKKVSSVAPSVYSFLENDGRHAGQFSQAAQMKRYKSSVAAGMKRFKIVRGNKGRLVVAHLETDRSFEKHAMKETAFFDRNGKMFKKMMPFYEGEKLSPDYDPFRVIFNPILNPVNPRDDKFYEIVLKLNWSGKPCEARGVDADASMIGLTLKDNAHHSESPAQVLQKDKFLPETRNCPYSSAIEQVYYYENNLAVFLDVYTMGFFAQPPETEQ